MRVVLLALLACLLTAHGSNDEIHAVSEGGPEGPVGVGVANIHPHQADWAPMEQAHRNVEWPNVPSTHTAAGCPPNSHNARYCKTNTNEYWGVNSATSEERAALLTLYQALGGASWLRGHCDGAAEVDDCAAWNTSTDHCNWWGVRCNRAGLVAEVALEGINLAGTIPSDISKLTALRWLRLSKNSIGGVIPPSIGSLHRLVGLHLQHNQLTGGVPSSMGDLRNLTQLYLQQNQLTGLPDELGSCTVLNILRLQGNQFVGTLPASLKDLSQLEVFNAARNSLTGGLPSQWGTNLLNLRQLVLHDNDLTGPVPATFAQMEALELLDMSRNDLGDSLQGVHLENMANLTTCNLQENQFSCPVPDQLVLVKKCLRTFDCTTAKAGGRGGTNVNDRFSKHETAERAMKARVVHDQWGAYQGSS